MYLLLLFTLLPLLELALLIKVGERIDVLPTIALVLTTGIAGAALARFEGLRTLRAVQTDLAQGQLPTNRLVDALLILVAGILLITPGLITDTVGLLLLIPPTRRLARERLKRWFRSRLMITRIPNFHATPDDDDLIDVDARDRSEGQRNDTSERQ